MKAVVRTKATMRFAFHIKAIVWGLAHLKLEAQFGSEDRILRRYSHGQLSL